MGNSWRPLDNVLFILFVCLIAVAVIRVVQDNFLLSGQFELLPLREIDDYAFQVTLRHWHQALDQGQFRTLFSMTDYGYGQLFWMISGLVTYPFYKLQMWPAVILLPRLISVLGFVFLSASLYLSSLKISGNKLISVSIALIPWLSPAVVLAAQRFHTHGYLAALSGLVLLCLMRFEERKARVASAFLAGLAGGIKANGLFLAPLVFLYSLGRLNRSFVRSWFQENVLMGLSLIAGFLTGLSPTLLFFSLFKEENRRVLDSLLYYVKFSKQNFGGPENVDPWFLFHQGLGHFIWPEWVFLILFVLAGLWIFKAEGKYRWFFISVTGSVLLLTVYLLFFTAQGPHAISNYFIAGGFCGLMVLTSLAREGRFGYLVPGLALAILAFQWGPLEESYSFYQNRMKTPEFQEQIATVEALRPLLPENSGNISILRDYRVPLPVSAFTPGYSIREYFENLHLMKSGKPLNFIFVSKKSVLMGPDEGILKSDQKEELLKAQVELKGLLQKNTLFGHSYEPFFENSSVIAYRRSPAVSP